MPTEGSRGDVLSVLEGVGYHTLMSGLVDRVPSGDVMGRYLCLKMLEGRISISRMIGPT
jgi:hypothetical protein